MPGPLGYQGSGATPSFPHGKTLTDLSIPGPLGYQRIGSGERSAEGPGDAESDSRSLAQAQLAHPLLGDWSQLHLRKLSHQGRRLLLVAGNDLHGLPGRDAYEVLNQDQARKILLALSAEPANHGEFSELLQKTQAALAPDWRPPNVPNGLVLLRRKPAPAENAAQQPAITPSQMRVLAAKSALEIRVVDSNQKPQEGLAFKIDKPDGGTESGKLDKDGRGRARSGSSGLFIVTFPDLDGADWDGDGAQELPPEEERSEAIRYKVKQGDRLATIARKNGFARWQTIWDFAGNAALKELRGNAHILFPGDEISIPNRVVRVAEVEGGTAEYVVRRDPDWWLRLQLHSVDDRYCPDAPYELTLPSGAEIKGKADAKGWLDCTIFADLTKCKIRYWPEGTDKPSVVAEVFLKEGQADSDEDFMNHLRNLGFANDDDSPASMVSRYQRYMDMPPTGQLDDQTKASIRKAIDKADDSVHQELGDDE
jgi:hypothetical protein